MDFFSRFFAQLSAFFNGLSLGRKIGMVVLLAMVIGGLAAIIIIGNHTEYRMLYADLSSSDASSVVDYLKQAKVPYRLEGNDKIMVPADKINEVRLDLAGKGLPQGGSVGFELFDQNTLGMSEYLQKLNYRRALQGELARTITHFNEVKFARVHIVVPERPLFAEDQTPTTASVVLQLREGMQLTASQVKSVVNLVANSVEGLKKDNITLVTTSGEMLFAGQSESPMQMASAAHDEFGMQIEKRMENKLRSIIEQAVGPGKGMVRVSADVTIRDLKQTRELYDPNSSAVRSEQRNSEESQNSEKNPSGVPGVKPNVIGQEPATPEALSNRYKKGGETINYEISKTIENVVEPVREVKRLSVAVLVDGTSKTVTDDKGVQTQEYVPRKEEEMAKLRALIEKAMGYSKVRGDQLEVVNLPFEQMQMSKSDRDWLSSRERRQFWAPYIKYGIMAVLALTVFLFVIRPIMKQILSAPVVKPEAQTVGGVPQLENKGQTDIQAIEAPEHTLEEKLVELAKRNPEQFAQGLRTWISEVGT